MRQEIDFLRGTRGEREKRLKFLRLVKTFSLLLLLAYCLVVAAFFSYSFYLTTASKQIARETALKKNKIEALKEIETLQIVLKQRLSNLLKFFDSQKTSDFPALLDYFSKTTQGISVKELSLSPDGKIKFSGEAAEMTALGESLENLTSEEASQFFSSVVLSSLDKKEGGGGYLFTILLEAKV